MDSTHASAVGGAGAAISAPIARPSRVCCQELTGEEDKSHKGLVSAAAARELGAWKKLKVFRSVNRRRPSKSVVDTRRALTWKMAEGKKNAQTRLAKKGYMYTDLKDGLIEP